MLELMAIWTALAAVIATNVSTCTNLRLESESILNLSTEASQERECYSWCPSRRLRLDRLSQQWRFAYVCLSVFNVYDMYVQICNYT
jgi:hypothetical protein